MPKISPISNALPLISQLGFTPWAINHVNI